MTFMFDETGPWPENHDPGGPITRWTVYRADWSEPLLGTAVSDLHNAFHPAVQIVPAGSELDVWGCLYVDEDSDPYALIVRQNGLELFVDTREVEFKEFKEFKGPNHDGV